MKSDNGLISHFTRPAVLCLIVMAVGSATVTLAQSDPISVEYGDVYQKGALKIEPHDLTSLPPLPPGYVAVNNKGYLITTTAMVSGPHVIRFSAEALGDSKAPGELRVFHAEPDTFDPDALMWVDRTKNSSPPVANQSERSLAATAYELGIFVVGRLAQKIAENVGDAELAVTSRGFPNPVVAPNNLTFTVNVTNNGPQPATDVGFVDAIPPHSIFVSAVPTQGTCKARTGSLYCKLGNLPASAVVTINLIVKPDEGNSSFPPEGTVLASHGWVRARENDLNRENNSFMEYVRALPDSNQPPTVILDAPKMGEMFVGPVDITVRATASDSDGTIAKVEFFDNGELIGLGTSTDGKHFQINERNVPYGRHNLWVQVTDDGGRQGSSNGATIITVNGVANVRVASPNEGSIITPGSNLTLRANALLPSGVITRVEFFANEQLLGEGALTTSGEYTFSWRDIARSTYAITAVATDGSGITTTSAPVEIVVSSPPLVTVVVPAAESHIAEGTNLSIRVKAIQPEGTIVKVDYYVDDLLIGVARDISTEYFLLTWRDAKRGTHSLRAVATNDLGITGKSPAVKIVVENKKQNHR